MFISGGFRDLLATKIKYKVSINHHITLVAVFNGNVELETNSLSKVPTAAH